MSVSERRQDILKVLENAGLGGMEERDLIMGLADDWDCHYSTAKRYITELESDPINLIKRRGSRLYHYMYSV